MKNNTMPNIHDLNEDGFVSDDKENFKSYSKELLVLTFNAACNSGQLDKIKYILTEPDLAKHFDKPSIEHGFKKAFENEQIDVIQYFIFEKNIEYTSNIIECMKGYLVSNFLFKQDTSPYLIKVTNMFTIRDLNQKLENELHSDSSKNDLRKLKL